MAFFCLFFVLPAVCWLLLSRIRGRGTDAHRVTAAACSHATAAAVMCFLRSWVSPPDSAGDGDGGGGSGTGSGHGTAKSGDGGRCGGSDDHNNSGSSGGLGFNSASREPSGLRALTIVDCPSLPPLAVLEAICVEDGAGLEYIAVGTSNPPPPPPLPPPSSSSSRLSLPLPPGPAVTHRQLRGINRGEEEEGIAEAGLSVGRGIGGRPPLPRSDEAAGQGSEGRAMGGGRSVELEVAEVAALACGWADGALTLSSEKLQGLFVAGEGGLMRLSLACPQLKRVEVVHCPSFGWVVG